MIRRFFAPPVFENDNDNFRATFINGFSWSAILLLLIALIPYLLTNAEDYTLYILPALILVMLSAQYLLRAGNIMASGLLIVVLGWLGVGIQAYTADGVKDVIIIAYIAISLLASIVINWRAGTLTIVSSIGAIWLLAILETNGFFNPRFQNPITFSRDLTFIFIIIMVLIFFSTRSLREAITRANQSEEKLLAANTELKTLNQILEERIEERTNELELLNKRNERRAKQFEVIADIARVTTSNEIMDVFLPLLVNVISEKFGFYHTGIFLIDRNREFAVLRAANSEGGKRMLQRGHKLQVGQTGLVGFVSATGAPRIALDVGADAIYFNNPDLPETHSEIALPLRNLGEIIGVLDVQSIETNAFNEDDIDVLLTLADQVASAIQNSINYETMQNVISKSHSQFNITTGDAWRILQEEGQAIGFKTTGTDTRPILNIISNSQTDKVIETNRMVVESGDESVLAVPLRIRNELVGVIDIRIAKGRIWDQDEIDIVQTISDRLGLALESTMLLKSAQKRAQLERITSDISNRINESSQFSAILRTAAEELSRALGGSEVLVQLTSNQNAQ